MKRFATFVLILLVSVGGTVGAFWYYQHLHAAPVFEGPRARLRGDLWRFEHAEKLSDKMEAAFACQNAEPGWRSELSESDLILKKAADALVEQSRVRVSAWETSLSRDEINLITESHPESIYRKAGKLRTILIECTQSQYQALRAHVELRELNERAYLITQWISQSEKPFEVEYDRRRIELLRDDKYWEAKWGNSGSSLNTEGRELRGIALAWFLAGGGHGGQNIPGAETLLSHPATSGGASVSVSGSANDSTDYTRQLMNAGVERAQIYETVVNYAVVAPDCIIGVHPEFVRKLRTEVTIERGKVLQEKLAQWIGQSGEADATFIDIPLDRSDSLFGSPNDAWGRPYIFKKQGNGSVQIFSSGEDPLHERNQIYVGEIQL